MSDIEGARVLRQKCDMIFRELQDRAPHPLPDHTRSVPPPEVRAKGS